MRVSPRLQHLCTLASALNLACPGLAQTPAPGPEVYIGLGAAWVGLRAATPVAGRPEPPSTACMALYGGARWRRIWGFELEQALYGDFEVPEAGGVVNRNVCTTSASAVGWLPLSDRTSAFARLGLAYWTATTGSGYAFLASSDPETATGATVHLGLGVEVVLGSGWMTRLEASLLPRVLDQRITRLGVGIAFRF